MIKDDVLFIDRIKLEVAVKLYYFKIKRAIEKHQATLDGKISQIYDSVI